MDGILISSIRQKIIVNQNNIKRYKKLKKIYYKMTRNIEYNQRWAELLWSQLATKTAAEPFLCIYQSESHVYNTRWRVCRAYSRYLMTNISNILTIFNNKYIEYTYDTQ